MNFLVFVLCITFITIIYLAIFDPCSILIHNWKIYISRIGKIQLRRCRRCNKLQRRTYCNKWIDIN